MKRLNKQANMQYKVLYTEFRDKKKVYINVLK